MIPIPTFIQVEGIRMKKILLCLFSVCLLQITAFSQIRQTYLSVFDNGSGNDTLWFGYVQGATCAADPLVPCEWIEPPPPPPAGVFDAGWLLCVSSVPGTLYGKCDIRGYINPADIDTHKVLFQPSDAGFPVTFRWSSDSILAMCDSAWLQDEFGGVIFRVRMHVVSEFVFVSPAFSRALVIRFGQDLLSGFREENFQIGSFGLAQNYPNPFNPSTRIEYQLPRKELVILKVYDVLGREVAAIVNQVQSSGAHSVEFATAGLSSGVYFYRLEAGKYVEQRKMLLLK